MINTEQLCPLCRVGECACEVTFDETSPAGIRTVKGYRIIKGSRFDIPTYTEVTCIPKTEEAFLEQVEAADA